MRYLPRAVPALVLTTLLFACGGKTPPAPQLAAPPAITSFTVAKSRIDRGEAVKLTFTAEHATSATLVDPAGIAIPLEGDALAGSATVSPTSTTFYVLRVNGE